jgi:hypothetical protein
VVINCGSASLSPAKREEGCTLLKIKCLLTPRP